MDKRLEEFFDTQSSTFSDAGIVSRLLELVDEIYDTSLQDVFNNIKDNESTSAWHIMDIPLHEHSSYKDNFNNKDNYYRDYSDLFKAFKGMTISYKEYEELVKVMSL